MLRCLMWVAAKLSMALPLEDIEGRTLPSKGMAQPGPSGNKCIELSYKSAKCSSTLKRQAEAGDQGGLLQRQRPTRQRQRQRNRRVLLTDSLTPQAARRSIYFSPRSFATGFYVDGGFLYSEKLPKGLPPRERNMPAVM